MIISRPAINRFGHVSPFIEKDGVNKPIRASSLKGGLLKILLSDKATEFLNTLNVTEESNFFSLSETPASFEQIPNLQIKCPSCQTELSIGSNPYYAVCINRKCRLRLARRLEYFCSMDALRLNVFPYRRANNFVLNNPNFRGLDQLFDHVAFAYGDYKGIEHNDVLYISKLVKMLKNRCNFELSRIPYEDVMVRLVRGLSIPDFTDRDIGKLVRLSLNHGKDVLPTLCEIMEDPCRASEIGFSTYRAECLYHSFSPFSDEVNTISALIHAG